MKDVIPLVIQDVMTANLVMIIARGVIPVNNVIGVVIYVVTKGVMTVRQVISLVQDTLALPVTLPAIHGSQLKAK